MMPEGTSHFPANAALLGPSCAMRVPHLGEVAAAIIDGRNLHNDHELRHLHHATVAATRQPRSVLARTVERLQRSAAHFGE
jgi:hypothetical protein